MAAPLRLALAAALTLAGTLAAAAIAAGPASATQPAWPDKCPIRIQLLIDRSSSMDGDFDDVRIAALALIDALRDKPTIVSVVGFGTTPQAVAGPVDISVKGNRDKVKRAVKDLDAYGRFSDKGATNWDAALQTSLRTKPDVVILITDGSPTVYGVPARAGSGVPTSSAADPDSLAAAVRSATRVKAAGTRIVPVGIDLNQGADANLAAVSGPTAGDDYFLTGIASLKRTLYEIAAASCGVPLAALPLPEPLGFPLMKVLIVAGAGVVLLLITGFVAARRRGGPVARAPGSSGVRRQAPLTVESVRGVRRDDGPRASPPGPR